jgi:hypothetical protein
MDLVSVLAAPLEPLYQVSPGRGRSAAVEEVLMMQPPPCPEHRHGLERREIDRLDVDRIGPVEVLLADLEQGLVDVAVAGVVDQDVEPAEGADRGLDHGLDLAAPGDVGVDEDGATAGRPDRLGHGAAGVVVDIGDHHGRPLPGKELCDALAEARAGPGYHRHLVLQAHAVSVRLI